MMIPTLQMAQEPRLRRLFALVGQVLAEGDIYSVEDSLMDVMLDIAPEFIPPDEDEYLSDWEELVADAMEGR